MNRLLKKLVLYISKYTGLFLVSKILTRHKLRIVCYHGFSHDDQKIFRPKLFIDEKTFRSRIKYLIKNKYNFITLDEFCDYLDGKSSVDLPILLTIDDGWKSTHDIALPVLKTWDIPHVIYLYTDCYQRKVPVLTVLLQYALWKSPLKHIQWSGKMYNLDQETDVENLHEYLMGEVQELDKPQINERLNYIFSTLNVNYSPEREWRYFSLLEPEEILNHISHKGSIQLHTHHHVNPLNDILLKEELEKNRSIVESITSQPAAHFCYPSGIYSRAQFPLLEKLNIKSAVTCNPGINGEDTSPYELNRLLDGEDISGIEFEAEISGFKDILRRIFMRLRKSSRSARSGKEF